MNPRTVRSQRFLLVRRGYDPEAVLDFLDEVADALEAAQSSSDDEPGAELADARQMVDEARSRAATHRLRAQRDVEALERTARHRRARLLAEIEELAAARDQLSTDLDRAVDVVDRVVQWVRRTDPEARPAATGPSGVDAGPAPAVASTDPARGTVATDDPATGDATRGPSGTQVPDGDDEPVGDGPVGDEPEADEPAADEPVVEPVGDEPVGREPVAAPVGDEPSGQEPVAAPVGDEPSGQDPIAAPVADEPVRQESVDHEAAAHEPAQDPEDIVASLTSVEGTRHAEEPAVNVAVRDALRDVQDDVLANLRDHPRGTIEEWLPVAARLHALDDAATDAANEAFLSGWETAATLDGTAAGGGTTSDHAVARDALEEVRGAGDLPGLDVGDELRGAIEASLRRGRDAGDVEVSLRERVAEVHRDLRQTRLPEAIEQVLSSARHRGAIARWRHDGVPAVAWVVGQERRCPGRRCRANADDGVVAPGDAFAFGEVVPPAHPGCTCTLRPVGPDEHAT